MDDWDALKSELLEDPEFRREYDRLGPLYGIITDLIRIRLDRGISQEELARRMGRQQPAIARFEGGNVTPSFRFLQDLAAALDVDLSIHLTPKDVAAPKAQTAAKSRARSGRVARASGTKVS
jgi:transcriptional regulator with XRE-family HTH domain